MLYAEDIHEDSGFLSGCIGLLVLYKDEGDALSLASLNSCTCCFICIIPFQCRLRSMNRTICVDDATRQRSTMSRHVHTIWARLIALTFIVTFIRLFQQHRVCIMFLNFSYSRRALLNLSCLSLVACANYIYLKKTQRTAFIPTHSVRRIAHVLTAPANGWCARQVVQNNSRSYVPPRAIVDQIGSVLLSFAIRPTIRLLMLLLLLLMLVVARRCTIWCGDWTEFALFCTNTCAGHHKLTDIVDNSTNLSECNKWARLCCMAWCCL